MSEFDGLDREERMEKAMDIIEEVEPEEVDAKIGEDVELDDDTTITLLPNELIVDYGLSGIQILKISDSELE